MMQRPDPYIPSSQKMPWVNHPRKLCGGCRTQRSARQFIEGSDRCEQCRRRGQ